MTPEADAEINRGLEHAKTPSYFRGHLFEVRGLVEERREKALRAKGLPFAYLAFEGEQHGFRKAQNIRRSLEAELYFYAKVFGFEPADAIEPVKIENL